MVQLLDAKPDIAKGFVRGNSASSVSFWDDLAAELNSLGPPSRDGTGWKKVWADYKSALKRKLSHNKRELNATGGGPNKLIHLSKLEEQAVQLTGLTATVDGIAGSSSQGAPKAYDKENVDINSGCSEESISGINETGLSQHSQSRRPRQTTGKLLELQVKQQQQFHADVKSIMSSSNKKLDDLIHYQRQSAKALISIDATLKQQSHEQQRHNKEMERLTSEKLELKRRILEMQIAYVSEAN
ncbi:uncharacterized protein LOC131681056 [Topomyia yanbarensis]|uniref:uncharacterized protein LOC131681056 n=1 Tax=Topomyia yanbarensis TaxID=2498891 RepID=UPI00273A7DE2|nr:uncharacterized protein LOC131681056 [Topomyia yanbarensis]